MLFWRVISAAVLILVLAGLFFLDWQFPPRVGGLPASGVWLLPLGFLAAGLGAAEVLALLRGAGLQPLGWTVQAGTLLIVAATSAPMLWPLSGEAYPENCPLGKPGWTLLALTVATAAVFLVEMRRFREPGVSVINVAGNLLTFVYIGALTSCLILLRLVVDHQWGAVAVLSLIAIVKMSDVGAYAVGRLVGRNKLSPVLSPGKTIEGAIGGVAASVGLAAVFYWQIVPLMLGPTVDRGPWWGWLLYGMALALAGLLGDLSESLLKRDSRQKDSSRWVPGFGGVLDVLDSILMAAPVALAFWIFGLVGPK